jgi:hypothetical protein
LINKKPSFIQNTNEVKSSVPELTGTLTIQAVEPVVASWGAEQHKLTAMCPEIGQYPITFWIERDKQVNQGDNVTCTFRRRRLQQDQGGNLKAGYYPDGKMVTWAWDWEIVDWNVGQQPVQQPAPQTQPSVQPQQTPPPVQPQVQPVVQQEVSHVVQLTDRDLSIIRQVAIKEACEMFRTFMPKDYNIKDWSTEDKGLIELMTNDIASIARGEKVVE